MVRVSRGSREADVALLHGSKLILPDDRSNYNPGLRRFSYNLQLSRLRRASDKSVAKKNDNLLNTL